MRIVLNFQSADSEKGIVNRAAVIGSLRETFDVELYDDNGEEFILVKGWKKERP